MKFNIFLLPTIPATADERIAQRPIGRSSDYYQRMVEEVRELTLFAEDCGFESLGMTEHHLHSEGFEVSVNPLLWFVDLAARTERIKFLTLGLVAPAWDPIRLAEETAMVDQLTGGRLQTGFARGYQIRWVNVLGQKYSTHGAASDGSSQDQQNREVYEEVVELVRKAWTQDTLTHKGKYYQVPFPATGIENWPAADFTRRYGSPGEVDENDTVKQLSVVPRPLQEPHPKIFQPFSISESTVRYTAEHDIVPYVLISEPTAFRRQCELYQEVAGQSGRKLGLGESIGAFRAVHFGDTEAQAVDLLERTHLFSWNEWFGSFGFWEALRLPGDAEKFPAEPFTPLPPSEWTTQRMRSARYAIAGTPDQVKRDFEDLATVHGAGGTLEYFSWFFDQGLFSLDEAKRQMEFFAKHIISEFA